MRSPDAVNMGTWKSSVIGGLFHALRSYICKGTGFRVKGAGFRVNGAGFRM